MAMSGDLGRGSLPRLSEFQMLMTLYPKNVHDIVLAGLLSAFALFGGFRKADLAPIGHV